MSALFLPVAFSLLAFSLTAPDPTRVQLDPQRYVDCVSASDALPAQATEDEPTHTLAGVEKLEVVATRFRSLERALAVITRRADPTESAAHHAGGTSSMRGRPDLRSPSQR
jgi:hypothetical protein